MLLYIYWGGVHVQGWRNSFAKSICDEFDFRDLHKKTKKWFDGVIWLTSRSYKMETRSVIPARIQLAAQLFTYLS